MTVIQIECIDQTLTITNSPIITSGDENNDYVEFSFCEKWLGHAKIAIFYKNKAELHYSTIDENGRCSIPNSMLVNGGTVNIGVVGYFNDNGTYRTKTSEIVRYKVAEGILDGVSINDPTFAELFYKQIKTANIVNGHLILTLKDDSTIDAGVVGIDSQTLEAIQANTQARHTHSNKAVLDDVTQQMLTDISDNKTARHTHTNKTVLDDLTSSVVSNSHAHSNKSTLDDITAQTLTDVENNTSARHTHSNKESVLDGLQILETIGSSKLLGYKAGILSTSRQVSTFVPFKLMLGSSFNGSIKNGIYYVFTQYSPWNLTPLTSLSITDFLTWGATAEGSEEYNFIFAGGKDANQNVIPSFSLPAWISWANGKELTVEDGKIYQVNIMDDIVAWCSIDSTDRS